MQGENVGYYLGAVVSILTLVGIVSALLTARRQRLSEARSELDKAFERGARSRDDEVALLRSERNTARVDRDDARRERDQAQDRLAWMQRPDGYPPHPGTPRRDS